MSQRKRSDTPVTIIGGYLGSGKTTLINHLLRNSNGRRLAIMVNDFGELPIDADLIEAEQDDLISLAGGCVCCSYGSGMTEAFLKLKEMPVQPDNIVLEASGVALPDAIAQSMHLIEGVSLDGIIGMVDCASIGQQITNKYLGDTIEKQLQSADLVVINKCDLVEADEVHRLCEQVKSLAPAATPVKAEMAAISPDIILRDFQRGEAHSAEFTSHDLEGYERFVEVPPDRVDSREYAQELLARFPGLLRAKGFVADLEGRLTTIQIVGKRVNVHEAPDDAKPGMVIIRHQAFV